MSDPDNRPEFDPGKYPDHLKADHKLALRTFEDICGIGNSVHLVAISPKGAVNVRRFTIDQQQRADIVVFMAAAAPGQDERSSNLYFCPNQSAFGNLVPDDGSIVRLRAVMIDIDPLDTTGEEAWRNERLRVKTLVHAAVMHPHLRPSLVIDTGNGAQLVYLIRPLEASDHANSLLRDTMKALARRFGGDLNTTHKVSGLFRIPGTCNIPGESKANRGRHRAFGGVWHRDTSQVYDLAQLNQLAGEGQPKPEAERPDEDFTAERLGLTLERLVAQARDLPENLGYRISEKMQASRDFRELVERLRHPSTSGDRSGDDYRFASLLFADRFEPAEVAACLGHYGASKATPLYSARWVSYVVRTVLHAGDGSHKSEDFWERSGPEPEPQAAPKDARRKRWFTAAELNARPFGGDRPLVQQLLPKRGLSMVYGESNSGKSLVALNICSCVASGEPFASLAVDASGLVVYVAMEGGGGLHKRIKALVRQHPERVLERLVCIIEPFSLHGATSEAGDLVAILQEIRAAHGGMHIDLLVIDMLAIAASGANENSAEDMSKVLDRIARIEQMFTCHVMTLHHTGKVLAKGARGWSGLRGRVDTEIEIGTTKIHKTGSIAVTKQRDMDFNPHARQGYVIRSVHLGDDGDRPVSGAVIELMETSGLDETSTLTETEQAIMDALEAIGQAALVQEIAGIVGKTTKACHFHLTALIRKKYVRATASKPRRYEPYLGFEDDDGPVNPFS